MTTKPQNDTAILPPPMWQRPLVDRGILAAALECGVGPYIQGKQSYWIYPVMNSDGSPAEIRPKVPAFRLKAMDSAAEIKYFWSPRDPQDGQPWKNPLFYFAPGFLQAVKDNGNVAIVASGEPDVWAWMSAGYRNVFSWYGEGNIPKEKLFDCLQGWGVEWLMLYPDLDETGQVSAAKLHRLLVTNGVKHHITLLPDSLGEGGDINKHWIASGFNPDTFTNNLERITYVKQDIEFDTILEKVVRACAGSWKKVWTAATANDGEPDEKLEYFWKLVVHAEKYPGGPAANVTPPARLSGPAHYGDEMPDEYYQAIQATLDPAMEFNADGWSRKPFPCPLTAHTHDSEKPAAYWHTDKKILKCFKCGERILAKQVAEALKIDYRVYLPLKQPHHRSTGLTGGKNDEPVTSTPKVNFLRKSHVDYNAPSSYIPMPFNALAKEEGFCEMLEYGLMTLIAGPSGSGKTSISESIADLLLQAGYTGIMYNPEWTDQSQIVRQVARMGGPSYDDQKKHLAYLTDIKAGVLEARVLAEGKRLMTDDQVKFRDSLIAEINEWPGEMYYVKPAESFDEIMEGFEAAYQASVDDGRPARILWFDYIQMVGYDYELIMAATNRLKNFCMTKKVHGIIISQFNGTGSKAARKGEKPDVGATAYINENVFNGVFLSQREITDGGIQLPSLAITIAKNSVGRSGQVVHLDYCPERLLVSDPVVRTLEKLDNF